MTRIPTAAAMLAAILLTGACAGANGNDQTVVVRKHAHSLTIRGDDGWEGKVHVDRQAYEVCAVGDDFPSCAQEAGS